MTAARNLEHLQAPESSGVCYNAFMSAARHRLPPGWLVVVIAAALVVYVRGFVLQTQVSTLPADALETRFLNSHCTATDELPASRVLPCSR